MLIFGTVALASGAATLFLPPLLRPTRESLLIWILAYVFMLSAGAAFAFLLFAIAQRRTWVLASLVLLTLGFCLVRSLAPYEEELWNRRFAATADLRQQFVQVMKQEQLGNRESRVKLPTELRTLTDDGSAVIAKGADGKAFYCYAVFTHGIDNSSGFCWSEGGGPPPRLAYPEIVRTRPMGGGWFFFAST